MEPTDIVYISAEAIVGFITVVGNCLVLAAIVRTRRLHTITNVFVGSLAIADIAVGVLVAPCAALSFMGLPKEFYGCVFINCLILMFTNVSILMLLSVAFERFLAIKEPFLYHRLLTVRRAVYVNICVWVMGSVLGLMPMYGWHGGYRRVDYCRFTDVVTYQYMVYFQFFGLVLLPLFIMLCIYIYILIIVRRHMRQTNALHNRFQQNNGTSDGSFNKDVRAAKMFAMVILMFGVMWFPVNIFNCVSLFCGNYCVFPKEALLAAIVMSHANSSINPLLYATSNSRIRGAIKEIFGIKPKPDERSSTDHNHMRQTTNGTPRARDNTVAPASSADESSNCKDDVRPFAISNDEFHPVMATMSIQPGDLHHEWSEEMITLNTIKHSQSNTHADHSSQSQNHKLHSLNSASLLSLAITDTRSERQSPVSRNPHQNEQNHTETDHSSCQYQEDGNPSPTSSLRYSHHHHKDIHSHHHDPPDLAFVNSEPLNQSEELSNQNEPTLNKTESNKVNSENDNTETGKINTEDFHRKYTNLWCWETSNHEEVQHGTDQNEVFPIIIYQHGQNGICHSPTFISFHERSCSSDSNEDFTVKNFNECISSQTTLSSLSYHRTPPSEELELTDFVEEEDASNKDAETENKSQKANSYASILVDEYGILRNSKTEHTKL